MGTYVHEDRGGQLAAARGGLAIGPGGVGAHIAKQFFRDEEATHMENITKSVNFACGQLRLGKDAAADAKALVVKACDGRWGEGEWTTMLTGACVYAASRQNALPITVRDVAEACQLDVFALGRVYNRLKFLHELKVPPLDPATFVARAAAAIPQLRDAMGGGDEDDARGGGDDASRASASAAKSAEAKSSRARAKGDKPVDRGAKLAPVVEDAKRLLAFAERRGLMTGRGPFPMVAAALAVAAAARGIALMPEAAAAGARAAVTSTKRSLVALKRELGAFAASCAWWRAPPDGSSMDDPDDPFASSGKRDRAIAVDASLPLALASLAAAFDADDGARLDAMPVAFRVADGVRAARLAKIERCKVTGSLDDDDGYGDEEYGDATGAEAATDRAEAGDAPSTSDKTSDKTSVVVVAGPPRRRAPKRLGPNRGGLKPRRRRKNKGGFAGLDDDDEGSRLAIGAGAAGGTNASPPPPGAARLLEGTGAGVGTNGAAPGPPFGWTDVLIQQLLLAGVPERLVVEEDGLFPDISVDQSTGAVKPVRAHPSSSSSFSLSGKNRGSAPDAGDEMEAAETAAHRVLERWRAESSRDPLLDAEAAAAKAGDDDGDDGRAAAARILAAREAVERADADAIAAIPDEDVAGLIRTEEEAAVVKAMAARRLVQFDADDGAAFVDDDDDGDTGDDGNEDGLVPVVKGERAEADEDDGAR